MDEFKKQSELLKKDIDAKTFELESEIDQLKYKQRLAHDNEANMLENIDKEIKQLQNTNNQKINDFIKERQNELDDFVEKNRKQMTEWHIEADKNYSESEKKIQALKLELYGLNQNLARIENRQRQQQQPQQSQQFQVEVQLPIGQHQQRGNYWGRPY
jgi:chromosome segregation ATPase